jgi:hypothetical protein
MLPFQVRSIPCQLFPSSTMIRVTLICFLCACKQDETSTVPVRHLQSPNSPWLEITRRRNSSAPWRVPLSLESLQQKS